MGQTVNYAWLKRDKILEIFLGNAGSVLLESNVYFGVDVTFNETNQR